MRRGAVSTFWVALHHRSQRPYLAVDLQGRSRPSSHHIGGHHIHLRTTSTITAPDEMPVAVRRSARLSAAPEQASASAPMPPPPKPARQRRGTGAPRKRKVTKTEDEEDGATAAASAPPAPPSTPPPRKKRRATVAASPAAEPPATPTPSAVGLISEPQGRPGRRSQQHPATVRAANPRATNAALLSPETSRVVVSAQPPIEDLSPVKQPAAAAAAAAVANDKPPAATTTATILDEACAYLVRVDARMRPLVEAHRCHIFSPEGLAEEIDPFESLCSGIISQQVSGAAARSIKAKFVALFFPPPSPPPPPHSGGDDDDTATTTEPPRRFPQPSQVAAASLERLRTAGLSQRKAEYVQGLAAKFASGELSAAALADAPYDEVVARLTAVRGLGQWSVEMFACFALKRMDVFSLGDLGVQRGMAAFVGRDVAKLKAAGKGGKWKYMNEADMRELSDRFKPYRSLFMWYMWRVEETDVSTME
ncbi:hypothetical protein RB597_007329 [Gaeumannomyces tritici]